MKRILSILLITTIFAGNLEVDGGLVVSGDIHSPTIDALRDDGNYEYKLIMLLINLGSFSI